MIHSPYRSNNNSNKRLDTAKTMTLTPAIKGQITKAVKTYKKNMAEVTIDSCLNFAFGAPRSERQAISSVFAKHMPRQQAKHATRKYLSTVTR